MQENKRPRIPARALAVAACAVALVGCAPEFEPYGMYTSSSYTSTSSYTSASAGSQRSASARPKVAVPDRALLEPQAEPDCSSAHDQQRPDKDRSRIARHSAEEQPASRSDGATATAALSTSSIAEGGQTDANADLALRIKLEYERECYRQAEMRVRDRLKQLQASTAQAIKTINRAEQGAR